MDDAARKMDQIWANEGGIMVRFQRGSEYREADVVIRGYPDDPRNVVFLGPDVLDALLTYVVRAGYPVKRITEAMSL